jgi:tetratricopeptide (TPR) repeat protein
MGYGYDRLGRWGEASELYKALIKSDRKDARAWNALGLDHDLLDRPKEAFKAFRKAVRAAPRKTSFAVNLAYAEGTAYFFADSMKSAAKSFAEALGMAPDSAWGRACLAAAQRRSKRGKEAVESMAKAVELAPNKAEYHLLLGMLHDLEGSDAEKAVKHYGRYIRLSGGGGEVPEAGMWIDRLRRH